MTTAQLGAAFPFIGGIPGGSGPLLGVDRWSQPFRFDVFALYRHGALTNPNVAVFGQLGRGKSSMVKSWVRRLAAAGCRVWVLDPKGEYRRLARALGATHIELRPGGGMRLNPLQHPVHGLDQAASLCAALAETGLGRPLRPVERAGLDGALATAHPSSLVGVVGALLEGGAEVRPPGMGPEAWAAEGREMVLELRRMVAGDLAGMFDGPTNQGLDPGRRAVVVDLSAVYDTPALAPVMVCAMAWMRSQLAGGAGGETPPTYLVLDEAWAVLAQLGAARWLRSSWKLARSMGLANVAVLHRLSDLSASGPAGSEQTRLAEGLLADTETRVLFGQSPDEARVAGERLGLSPTEVAVLPRLPRGMALWSVAGRSAVIRHVLDAEDLAIVDTDHRMAPGAAP
ncbi:MAG TPA: DUF87 domain-containing protein [Acidimicrobiales bacterium]